MKKLLEISKNKKIIVTCMIIFVLLLSFFIWYKSVNTTKNNNVVSLPEYPIIDGSTSTITMHAAIQAHLTDRYFSPKHSKTFAALDRIIPDSKNPADIILAVKYYDDTLKDVKKRGADLVITPIAKEGFVFILHKDNPVKSLTKQQLKDIYSGKIKNWKEVGGKDEKIKLLTRNEDSGSQTAMEDFMGGTKTPEGHHVIGSMGDMLYSISETGSSAIGYNIYSWSMGQNVAELNLKTVAVDNIVPSNKTLANDSYPLLVYTYSYYNKGNIKGKNLTDWLLTADGQKVIASAGYVGISGELPPNEPLKFDKDEIDSENTILEYYEQKGWETSKIAVLEMIDDEAQIKMLSGGKNKYVTVIRVCSYIDGDAEQYFRFIVLTREKGGKFEVINEGEIQEYTNGVITPGDTENHFPPK